MRGRITFRIISEAGVTGRFTQTANVAPKFRVPGMIDPEGGHA